MLHVNFATHENIMGKLVTYNFLCLHFFTQSLLHINFVTINFKDDKFVTKAAHQKNDFCS